jgi:hypothetical protein
MDQNVFQDYIQPRKYRVPARNHESFDMAQDLFRVIKKIRFTSSVKQKFIKLAQVIFRDHFKHG